MAHTLSSTFFAVVFVGTSVACGSSTGDTTAGRPGASGSGGAAAGASATGGDVGTSGGAGSGGQGATGGNSAGSGGAGGSGASSGAGAGAGGAAAGTGGAAAGGTSDQAGAGGSSAGTGGSAAGSGGCGPCPGFACGAPFMATVSASNGADIADLQADSDFGVTCTRSSTMPCTWTCLADQTIIPTGDHSVTFTAPGFDPKTIDFSLEQPTNCGCCGCPCALGFVGNVELGGDGEAGGCCADRRTDPDHCGTCGTACSAGDTCYGGHCVGSCAAQGQPCGASTASCCDNLTCCPGANTCQPSCTR